MKNYRTYETPQIEVCSCKSENDLCTESSLHRTETPEVGTGDFTAGAKSGRDLWGYYDNPWYDNYEEGTNGTWK